MATRQRFMLPDRLLRKYSQRPSGDQTGFQSNAGEVVVWTGLEPSAATVQMSRTPLVNDVRCSFVGSAQKAIRRPFGDTLG